MFSKLGCTEHVPDSLKFMLTKAPVSIVAGILGATLWGIYDILTRYRSIDLTPESLHFIWLRVLLSGTLGYFVSFGLKEDFAVFIAFGIGVFPLKTLKNLIYTKTLKQLKITQEQQQSEPSELHKIEGLSEGVINRLAEEGIDSVQHLAFCDPIKLLLKTNLEWKIILDIMDQSLLFIYLGDRSLKLRPIGIRGAIELATITIDLESEDEIERNNAEKMVPLISKKIGEDTIGVGNLMRTISVDSHVSFVWSLWGEAETDEDDDAATEEDEMVC
jgi:hypothetical protein